MARSSVVSTFSSVSANSCTHPKGMDGRAVCHHKSPQPGREWPLAVWSCWWMAVQTNKPPLGVRPEVDDYSDLESEVELEVLSDVGSETEPHYELEAESQPADTSGPIEEPESEVLPESPLPPQPKAEEEHGTVERFKSGCQCRECRLAMSRQLKEWRKELGKKARSR